MSQNNRCPRLYAIAGLNTADQGDRANLNRTESPLDDARE